MRSELRRSYLIKWQGYSDEHNEWMEEENWCEALVEAFELSRPDTTDEAK